MKTDQESECGHTKELHVKESLTTSEFASFSYLKLPTDIPEVECQQIYIFFARVTYEVAKSVKTIMKWKLRDPTMSLAPLPIVSCVKRLHL